MIIRKYNAKTDYKKVKNLVSSVLDELILSKAKISPNEVFQELVVKKDYFVFFIVEYDDNILACLGLKKLNSHTLLISRIYVHKDYRRRGIGQTLLNKSLRLAKEKGYSIIKIRILTDMDPLRKFLKKNQFIEQNNSYKLNLIKNLT